MTQKAIAIAGLAVTILSLVVGAAVAHGDMGSRVSRSEERLDRLEGQIGDVLWNVALLCERSGAQGCRSAGR